MLHAENTQMTIRGHWTWLFPSIAIKLYNATKEDFWLFLLVPHVYTTFIGIRPMRRRIS